MADKLMKPNSNPLPALPTMFGNLAPVELPEMDYGKGLVSNFFQKKKLKQASEASKYRAEVAEYQEREVKANAERLMTALMFGRKYELEVARVEHQKTMFQMEAYHKQEIIKEQVYKNTILEHEIKDIKLNRYLKMKDLGITDAEFDEDR